MNFFQIRFGEEKTTIVKMHPTLFSQLYTGLEHHARRDRSRYGT